MTFTSAWSKSFVILSNMSHICEVKTWNYVYAKFNFGKYIWVYTWIRRQCCGKLPRSDIPDLSQHTPHTRSRLHYMSGPESNQIYVIMSHQIPHSCVTLGAFVKYQICVSLLYVFTLVYTKDIPKIENQRLYFFAMAGCSFRFQT